jgi:hypothetical protein
MFYFVEYFIRKAISNGVSLLIISAFLFYLNSGEIIHHAAICIFLSAAILWIVFGLKFKSQLNSIDETESDESEEKKVKIFKISDSILSSILVVSIILTFTQPIGTSFYVLLSVSVLMLIIRAYQIIVISKYLKAANRN